MQVGQRERARGTQATTTASSTSRDERKERGQPSLRAICVEVCVCVLYLGGGSRGRRGGVRQMNAVQERLHGLGDLRVLN